MLIMVVLLSMNKSELDIKARVPSEGNVTGSDPNLFVGNSMKPGQSCVPSSVNFQVMGNTILILTKLIGWDVTKNLPCLVILIRMMICRTLTILKCAG